MIIHSPNYLIHGVKKGPNDSLQIMKGINYSSLWFNITNQIKGNQENEIQKTLVACIIAMLNCKRNSSLTNAPRTHSWEWGWGNISSIHQHNPRKRSIFIRASIVIVHTLLLVYSWTFYLKWYITSKTPKLDIHIGPYINNNPI